MTLISRMIKIKNVTSLLTLVDHWIDTMCRYYNGCNVQEYAYYLCNGQKCLLKPNSCGGKNDMRCLPDHSLWAQAKHPLLVRVWTLSVCRQCWGSYCVAFVFWLALTWKIDIFQGQVTNLPEQCDDAERRISVMLICIFAIMMPH